MSIKPPSRKDDRALRAEVRKYRQHLSELTEIVGNFLRLTDEAMKGPSTPERGKRIAALCNQLEMSNDKIRYLILGIDWRKDKKK